MTVRALTRHPEDFDIFTEHVDSGRSSYVTTFSSYTGKIAAFYRELGVTSAIWAIPEHHGFQLVEYDKPVEYVLEVNDDRIIAYVDDASWTAYLSGQHDTFRYSTTPEHYELTSLLIRPPLRRSEVKIRRLYRTTNGPCSFELVDETVL